MAHSHSRLVFRYVSTATWLWAVSLSLMWAKRFGLREPVIFTCTSAALTAFALGMVMPGQIFWLAHALIVKVAGVSRLWLRPRGNSGGQAPLENSPGRFYAIAIIIAALLSFLSALCVFAVGGVYLKISRSVLFSGHLDLYTQWILLFIALLPWGLAAALVNRSQGRFARNRSEFRKILETSWPFSLAGASFIAIGWVSGGFDPVLLAFVVTLSQLAIGCFLYNHPGPSVSFPEDIPSSASKHNARHRIIAFVMVAALGFSAVISMKSLVMILGGTIWMRLASVVAVVFIGAIMQRRWIGRRFTHSGKISAGAAILASSSLCLQLLLLSSAITSEGINYLLIVLVVLSAFFVLAGAVVLFLSCRYWFLATGGADRQWRQILPLALALGLFIAAAGPLEYLRASTIMISMLALLAFSVLGGITVSRKMVGQLTWSLCGAVLMLVMGWLLTRSALQLRRDSDIRLSVGNYMDSWQRGDSCGYFPLAESGGAMIDHLESLLYQKLSAEHIGNRWLVVDQKPLGRNVDTISIDYAVLDKSVTKLGAWDSLRAEVLNMPQCLSELQVNKYHGIIYSPARDNLSGCDHHFHGTTAGPLYKSLSAGGLLIVHFEAEYVSAAPSLYSCIEKLFKLPGVKAAVVNDTESQIEAAVFIFKSRDHSLIEELSRQLPLLPGRWLNEDKLSQLAHQK